MEALRYFAAAGICAALFWGVYSLLLRNRPAHRTSRIYLILAMILPGILPLIRLPETAKPATTLLVVPLPEFNAGQPVPATGISFGALFMMLYLAGALVTAFVYLRAYLRLRTKLSSQSPAVHDGYKLIRETSIGPGTLGRMVFFPGADTEPAILRHELAHIRAGHRYDLLLLVFCRVIFWLSPAHWLLGRELKIVHEFEADQLACDDSPSTYSNILLAQQFHTGAMALSAHAFFHHPLKRRIMMLQRKAGGYRLAAAAAFVLTTGLAASVVLAHNGTNSGSRSVSQTTPLDTVVLKRNYMQPQPGTVQTMADGRILFTKVERMPYFNGELMKWLVDNVRAPQKDIKGRCVVQFTVDASGNVVQPFISQSSKNPLLDAEALRVVRSMPKWTPGLQGGAAVSVLYSLPFNFGAIGDGC